MSVQKITLQKKFLLVFVAFLMILQSCHCQNSKEIDLSFVNMPEGFKIEVFAQVPNARQLIRSDKGTIFVSTRSEGKVYALKDTNGDNKADMIKLLAQGLNMPNGVALKDGNLYVAQVSRIIRFDDIQNNLDSPKYVVVKDDFPTDKWHGWKFIAFGPDGKLYVPIGAPCNICDKGDPYASITRMNPDGSQFQIFVRGVRNTVGFDWDPKTGYIWFTDNGRDMLGNDIPPDQLNHATKPGLHFGYPYCHAGSIADPEFGQKRKCSQFEAPSFNFDAHVAALGVNFYDGKTFPSKYQGGMFIAQHGSWNRDQKIGYRLKFIQVDGEKVVYQETFADGWLQKDKVLGRPVDTQELADGSLLVSDDQKGLVYRISYSGPKQQVKSQVSQLANNDITQVTQKVQTVTTTSSEPVEPIQASSKQITQTSLKSTQFTSSSSFSQSSQPQKPSQTFSTVQKIPTLKADSFQKQVLALAKKLVSQNQSVQPEILIAAGNTPSVVSESSSTTVISGSVPNLTTTGQTPSAVSTTSTSTIKTTITRTITSSGPTAKTTTTTTIEQSSTPSTSSLSSSSSAGPSSVSTTTKTTTTSSSSPSTTVSTSTPGTTTTYTYNSQTQPLTIQQPAYPKVNIATLVNQLNSNSIGGDVFDRNYIWTNWYPKWGLQYPYQLRRCCW